LRAPRLAAATSGGDLWLHGGVWAQFTRRLPCPQGDTGTAIRNVCARSLRCAGMMGLLTQSQRRPLTAQVQGGKLIATKKLHRAPKMGNRAWRRLRRSVGAAYLQQLDHRERQERPRRSKTRRGRALKEKIGAEGGRCNVSRSQGGKCSPTPDQDRYR